MSDESKKPFEQDQPVGDDAPENEAPGGEQTASSESGSEDAAPIKADVSDDPSALGENSQGEQAEASDGVEDPEIAAAREAAQEGDQPAEAGAGDGNGGDAPPPAPADMAGDGDSDDADEDEDDEDEAGSMSFTDHLQELRVRLTRCFIALAVGFLACYGFSKQLFDILMEPLVNVFPPGSHLIFTALPEAFFTYIKIALVAGFFVTSPFIFYQLWLFVAPGLYKEERKYLIPIGFISALFFVVGACFGYFVVFPFAFEFFMGFTTEFIKPFPKLNEYLGFSLKLLFAFGVIFELPLVIFFLARLGLVTSAMLRKHRKYSFLGCFVVSAVLTPPDVVSQLLMAGPLMLLYEISIYVAQIFGRREKKKTDEEPDEEDENEDSEATEADQERQ